MSVINKIQVQGTDYDIEDSSALKEVPSDYKTKQENDQLYQAKGNYITEETDPVFSASASANITSEDITNWNNKSDFSGNYNDLSNKPDLSGFITNAVDDLLNYYKKSETYTQNEVNTLINAITTINILVVQELPTEDISPTTIYLVPKSVSLGDNLYDEYIYVSNAWEKIGDTQVDLTNYVTNTDYATSSTGGVLKVSNGDYGIVVDEGVLKGAVKTASQFSDMSSKGLVAKGTLNNILASYQVVIDNNNKLSSDLVDDTNNTNKFVTSAEKTTWNGKQDTLVSGTNIKTINDTSLLGDGNITISGGQTIQYSTMPTASAENLGQIVQYTGTNTGTAPIYLNSHFYKCVSDGASTPTYSWKHLYADHIFISGTSDLAGWQEFIGAFRDGNAKFMPVYYGDRRTVFNNGNFNNSQTSFWSEWITIPSSYQNTNGDIRYLRIDVDLSNGLVTNVRKIQDKYFTLAYKASSTSDFSTFGSPLATNNTYSYTPSSNYHPATKKYVDDKLSSLSGYDATKTQVLKNVSGTLTWVDE